MIQSINKNIKSIEVNCIIYRSIGDNCYITTKMFNENIKLEDFRIKMVNEKMMDDLFQISFIFTITPSDSIVAWTIETEKISRSDLDRCIFSSLYNILISTGNNKEFVDKFSTSDIDNISSYSFKEHDNCSLFKYYINEIKIFGITIENFDTDKTITSYISLSDVVNQIEITSFFRLIRTIYSLEDKKLINLTGKKISYKGHIIEPNDKSLYEFDNYMNSDKLPFDYNNKINIPNLPQIACVVYYFIEIPKRIYNHYFIIDDIETFYYAKFVLNREDILYAELDNGTLFNIKRFFNAVNGSKEG